MSGFIAGNRYLSKSEMETNAKYIRDKLLPNGWTLNAICAMLGNMQTESSINPAIWESLDNSDTSRGFGLVQWTPSTKYTSWCSERGLDPSHMDSALARIEYELENGLQWYATDSYPMSFAEFKTSTLSPSYLADAFLKNYERPAEQNQPARGTQAQAWYDFLLGDSGGSGGSSSGDSPAKRKKMSLLLMYMASKR